MGLFLRVFSLFITLIISLSSYATSYVFVTNVKNEINSISKTEVREIYLGNSFTWINGKKAIPLRLELNDGLDDFLSAYVGMSVSNFNAYWRRRLFSGKAIPPKHFTDVVQLVHFMSEESYSLSPFPDGELTKYPQLKIIKITETD